MTNSGTIANSTKTTAAALERYVEGPPAQPSDWRRELERQLGVNALRLVAPQDEPAFLQPPTDATLAVDKGIDDLDVLFVGVGHEVMPRSRGTPEQWVYALMSGLLRPYANFNPNGSRAGMACALPLHDGSIGPEIRLLADAYRAMPPGLVGEQAHPTSAADHMVWLRPWPKDDNLALSVADLPHPYLEAARRLRLVEQPDGSLVAKMASTRAPRVNVSGVQGRINDPHVAVGGTGPYRLFRNRVFDRRFQHALLFGNAEVQRPRVLDLAGSYRVVRLCALGTENGKTFGYRERLLSAAKRAEGFRLGPPDRDRRPADLSAMVLGQLKNAEARVVYAAAYVLHPPAPGQDAANRAARARMAATSNALVGDPSVQLVLDLLQDAPDPARESAAIQTQCAEGAEQAFNRHAAAVETVDPLRAARARVRLEKALNEHLPGADAMIAQPEKPPLVRQTEAVIGEIAAHATPDDRATLRTVQLSAPPLRAYTLLAGVPRGHLDDPAALEAWLITARALGSVRPGGVSVGRALWRSGHPERRVEQLLTASGGGLRGLAVEVVRWLDAQGIARVWLPDLTALMLADALGDREAVTWLRRRIALDYAGASRPRPGQREKATEAAAEGARAPG